MLGTIIGERYKLVDIVGQGGMGIVYRAADTRLADRPCAIKLLSGTSMDPDEAIRFERELNIIARLRNPNVVQVIDTGSLPDNRRYIVMELLEGLPLSALIKSGGPLDAARAIKIGRGVLGALSEAHEFGVIHRDLKPANVFVTRSRSGNELAKVLDFGIAKEVGGSSTPDLTAASMLIGTPKYMAPEQFLKKGADQRTDLYSVGLLLYQMLSGQPPFHAQSPVPESLLSMPEEFRVGWLHVNQMPTPLAIVPGLWAIIERLLSKSPDDRFPDANSTIEALRALDSTQTTVDTSTAHLVVADPFPAESSSSTTGFPIVGYVPDGSPSSPSGKRRLLAGIGMVLAAGAIAGGAWFFTRPPKIEPSPTTTAPIKMCHDKVVTEPAGAEVHQGATKLGLTPLTIERPCRESWMVRIDLADHKSQTLALRGRQATSLRQVKLESLIKIPVKKVEAPREVPPEPVKKKAKPRAKPKHKRQPARKQSPLPF